MFMVAYLLTKSILIDSINLGHVFCWAMVMLFGMTIFSLLIYQFRSILWLKLHVSQRKQQSKFKEEEGQEFMQFLPQHGQQSNYNHIALESGNR